MTDALIGYTGFVGSTLLKQRKFEGRYRSTNIRDIEGQSFDTLVCAGAPAQKWIANQHPEDDARILDGLMSSLGQVDAKRMILISTVDVFMDPRGVDEQTSIDMDGLHAYGLNRRRLEIFCQERFSDCLIVRLPGLVGPGLRKNVIHDLQHDNDVHKIDTRGVFQFYPMVNLWFDIELALQASLKLVHLTAEPISVQNLFAQGFGVDLVQETLPTAATYDMRTLHASVFGGRGDYQYSARDTVQAVRSYHQSEPSKGN